MGAAPGLWESAVLVPVPEAEPAVGSLRGRLDRAAGWGVPAHVTVLYPFLPPAEITGVALEKLTATVALVPAFTCEFSGTGWFGEDVLWLAPRPAAPFQALTNAVFAAFPQFPPFGGAFAEVVPHLTVGHLPDGGGGLLRAAEAEVLPGLPVRARISHTWLMVGTEAPGSWRMVATLPLST